MNETITTEGGRTKLRMERRLAHPPRKVWRAITDPEHIRQWFPARMSFDGDRITYEFGPEGRVLERQEPRVFAHTWGEDELRWEILPDGEGSLLVFTHTFADTYGAASFATGWHVCVRALAVLLDGRTPDIRGDTARLHEDYVAILGLISGQVEDGTLRLERQLPRHAEQVWQTLNGDAATVGAPPPAGFVARGVQAGPVTRVEAGKVLEFGGVRWELGEGTGQGARLILTHTGGAEYLAAWRSHVEDLADRLARAVPAS